MKPLLMSPTYILADLVCLLLQVMWCGFGVVWDLRLLGLVDTHTEEVANLCCDFAAKVTP